MRQQNIPASVRTGPSGQWERGITARMTEEVEEDSSQSPGLCEHDADQDLYNTGYEPECSVLL